MVICSYVDNWRHIRDGRVYVIISQSEGIVVKRVINRLGTKNRPHIICQSDNEAVKPFWLLPDEIAEVWRFEARLSFDLQPPSDLTDERLAKLEDKVETITGSLEAAGLLRQQAVLGTL